MTAARHINSTKDTLRFVEWSTGYMCPQVVVAGNLAQTTKRNRRNDHAVTMGRGRH